MPFYIYSGPVKVFDAISQENYQAKTYAATARKAKSNLAYRWKKENGYLPSAKVTLTGKIMEAGE